MLEKAIKSSYSRSDRSRRTRALRRDLVDGQKSALALCISSCSFSGFVQLGLSGCCLRSESDIDNCIVHSNNFYLARQSPDFFIPVISMACYVRPNNSRFDCNLLRSYAKKKERMEKYVAMNILSRCDYHDHHRQS